MGDHAPGQTADTLLECCADELGDLHVRELREKMSALAEVFRSLAHPLRIGIRCLLEDWTGRRATFAGKAAQHHGLDCMNLGIYK